MLQGSLQLDHKLDVPVKALSAWTCKALRAPALLVVLAVLSEWLRTTPADSFRAYGNFDSWDFLALLCSQQRCMSATRRKVSSMPCAAAAILFSRKLAELRSCTQRLPWRTAKRDVLSRNIGRLESSFAAANSLEISVLDQ